MRGLPGGEAREGQNPVRGVRGEASRGRKGAHGGAATGPALCDVWRRRGRGVGVLPAASGVLPGEECAEVKALSVRQPFAELIASGRKTIEVRSLADLLDRRGAA